MIIDDAAVCSSSWLNELEYEQRKKNEKKWNKLWKSVKEWMNGLQNDAAIGMSEWVSDWEKRKSNQHTQGAPKTNGVWSTQVDQNIGYCLKVKICLAEVTLS